jgi:hypothetical protein
MMGLAPCHFWPLPRTKYIKGCFRGYLIDISHYRLLLGFFLLYTDRVTFELLDSAALL